MRDCSPTVAPVGCRPPRSKFLRGSFRHPASRRRRNTILTSFDYRCRRTGRPPFGRLRTIASAGVALWTDPVARSQRIDNQAALVQTASVHTIARREESRSANFLLEPWAILRSCGVVSSKIFATRHLVVAPFFSAHATWGIDKFRVVRCGAIRSIAAEDAEVAERMRPGKQLSAFLTPRALRPLW